MKWLIIFSTGKYHLFDHPNEIIEMIFFHCDNILKLTLVCPSLNILISQSPTLMGKVKVTWNAELLKSSRKYSRLSFFQVHPIDWEQLITFIKKYKKSLIEIVIDRILTFQLEPKYYEILSTLSQTLKKLTTNFLPGVETFGMLEFPNLEEWICATRGDDVLTFQSWKTPNLKKLTIGNGQMSSKRNLVSFLKEQLKLQVLEIRNGQSSKDFLEAASVFPFPFNLNKLKLTLFINDSNLPFSLFARSLKQPLKALSMEYYAYQEDDFRQILEMGLEELELTFARYGHATLPSLHNQTIKKLSLKLFSEMMYNEGLEHVLESFQGVETLFIEGFRFSTPLTESIASTLPKLKNLDLSSITYDFPLGGFDFIRILKNSQQTSAKDESGKAPEHEFVSTANVLTSLVKDCTSRNKELSLQKVFYQANCYSHY